MLNLNLASFYSLSCALLPCICVLIWRRKMAPLGHRAWALIFCLYLWMVYTVTGGGGSQIFSYSCKFSRSSASTASAISTPHCTIPWERRFFARA